MAAVGSNCPVCGGTTTTGLLSLPPLPVAINAQVRPEDGPGVDRGEFELVICNGCAHLFNAAFDPDLCEYDSSYENSLHFSARFREHSISLARRLVADHDLVGATAAEAGSGPGHFLAHLCETGVERAYGFDPSYDPDRLGSPDDTRVTVSNSYFPDDGSLTVKLALSQHVLEHLTEPVGLLSALRSAVVSTPGGVVYSEVPNGDMMLARVALWDLIYEHFSYFTATSLSHACRRAGLTAPGVVPMFDDQFMAVTSAPTEADHQAPDNSEVDAVVGRAVSFGEQARKQIDRARDDLDRHLEEGPVALWGAGSKGRTYLNLVAADGQVDAVIDVNPRKEGFGIPGTTGTIGLPETLVAVQPATVLIANPVYRDEIRSSLQGLGVHSEVIALWS